MIINATKIIIIFEFTKRRMNYLLFYEFFNGLSISQFQYVDTFLRLRKNHAGCGIPFNNGVPVSRLNVADAVGSAIQPYFFGCYDMIITLINQRNY
jgi:hypothetical protein